MPTFDLPFKFRFRKAPNCVEYGLVAQRPPPVDWLLSHRSDKPRAQTLGRTPIASLYRMYEYIVLHYNTGLRTEIEWFFNQKTWAVADIPDPADPDPARYAILAVIPQFMIVAYNRLIELGLPRGSPAIIRDYEHEMELKAQPVVLETLPAWATRVPRLKTTLLIPDGKGNEPEDEYKSPQFRAMNIIVQQPHVLFV